MHPAYSIIFFTTASGLGYGLLVFLGVYGAFGLLPAGRWFGLVALGLALALITGGLLSSTFHLGHPERAWRALTQWRSSWLSREGVLALLTYAPACLLAAAWFREGGSGGGFFGLLAAAGALATVYATSMIYASLRAVPRWHNRLVPPVYLSLALMTGALWFDALLAVHGSPRPDMHVLALLAIALAWGLKRAYWRSIDRAADTATAGSATGLGRFGTVRLLESPHTGTSFLLQEMGYRVARKHARKLRRIAVVSGFASPFALTAIGLFVPSALTTAFVVLAALSGLFGTVVERWLFFAEANHAVTLYYGEDAV
jgi:DMSO reductase anchor subunit